MGLLSAPGEMSAYGNAICDVRVFTNTLLPMYRPPMSSCGLSVESGHRGSCQDYNKRQSKNRTRCWMAPQAEVVRSC